jgi:hypothetical protein
VTDQYTLTPVVLTGGRIAALDTAALLPSTQVDLVDANRFGAVAGKWPGGNRAAVRELSLPGEGTTDLFAAGIDEDGTVLGTRGNPTDAVPYVWPAHGAAYQLTAPAGTTRPVGNAIRNGWVVGTAYRDDQAVGVRWNLRTGRSEIVSTDHPALLVVNGHGTAGGYGAVIHRDGRAVALDSVAPYPVLITDTGVVAAGSGQGIGPARHRLLPRCRCSMIRHSGAAGVERRPGPTLPWRACLRLLPCTRSPGGPVRPPRSWRWRRGR